MKDYVEDIIKDMRDYVSDLRYIDDFCVKTMIWPKLDLTI